jgi:hypothetical protein
MARGIAAWSLGGLALLAGLWSPVQAGETLARLEVRVADLQGRPVPVVRVEAASPARGIARGVALTDDGGVARFLLLPPAAGYRVTVSAGGFGPWASAEFALGGGELAVLEATLRRPGEPAGDEPGARPRLLDPERAGERTSFDAGAIEKLPIMEGPTSISSPSPPA